LASVPLATLAGPLAAAARGRRRPGARRL